MSRFALLPLAAATGVLVVIGAGEVSSQGTGNCLRTKVTAEGQETMWNRKPEAMSSASIAWMLKARQQVGAPYADWSKARSKEINCRTISKSTIRCTATATPCK